MTDPILLEISVNSFVNNTPQCVLCDSEMRIMDIATQSVQEEGAGMYSCQTCLPVEIEWWSEVTETGKIKFDSFK